MKFIINWFWIKVYLGLILLILILLGFCIVCVCVVYLIKLIIQVSKNPPNWTPSKYLISIKLSCLIYKFNFLDVLFFQFIWTFC